MILWVADLASKAIGKENVYIATEDLRICKVVEEAGFQCVMTGDALTGTDRIAEVAESVEADVYLNVQGDEPVLNPSDIIRVRDAKIDHPDEIINAYTSLSSNENPTNVNIPKVVVNESGYMLYMSRAKIPGFKSQDNEPNEYLKQVCIYGFSRDELLEYKKFGRKSALEISEDIEILRFLEFKKRIRMIRTDSHSLAVDVPEDVANVETVLRRREQSS